MKVLLIGINAKYIHTNLAIRLLQAYAQKHTGIPIETREFTINQSLELIFGEIIREAPDLLGLSCYIWNWELIKKLVPQLKKVLPNTTIFLGGPEVSFDDEQALRESGADLVIRGEGEVTFTKLLTCFSNKETDDWNLAGLTIWHNGTIRRTPDAPSTPMDDLPFVYQDLSQFTNQIIYYETMRGCPFQCQYCLSSVGQGVRFRALDKVFPELQQFLDQKVRQVKFVDRTFNCNKAYAKQIWQYLIQHDNGVSNFHFEVAAELLDQELIQLLSTARKGLFQLEIGVQSTNSPTLEAIRRNSDFDRLAQIVRQLQKPRNIHLHLDLIAGLPFEDYKRFAESFNQLYMLHPDQLQLGFLKLLKGSGLHRDQEKYEIVCQDDAPYEVLFTHWISPLEMRRLKEIENMVELYYNSCRYQRELALLVPQFSSPFAFFEALSNYYYRLGFHLTTQGKLGHYDILYRFFTTQTPGITPEMIRQFLFYAKHDLLSHERVTKLPDWIPSGENRPLKDRISGLLAQPEWVARWLPEYQGEDPKRVIRMIRFEAYPMDPRTGEKQSTILLYNYKNTDLLGNAAVLELPTESSRQ